jgi:hypothetical protein
VVETNKPGGGWWFYKMYADLGGGDAVAVTRPDTTSLDALDAIAMIDDHRRQARIVAGGTADPFNVIVENIDRETFGATVHVRLSATTWSGQNSAAPPPAVMYEDVLALHNGSLTIPVRGLGFHGDGATNVDRMAAYEIVLSRARAPSHRWSCRGERRTRRRMRRSPPGSPLRRAPKLIADTGEWGTYAWGQIVLGTPGLRVAGGTDEVMRNIVGERVLGLQKDPGIDSKSPFKDIKVGTQKAE